MLVIPGSQRVNTPNVTTLCCKANPIFLCGEENETIFSVHTGLIDREIQ